jgi:hypothetical protein
MAASKSVAKAKPKATAKPKAKVKATAPKSNGKGIGKAAGKPRRADVEYADPALFDPLTPGETADALRTLV